MNRLLVVLILDFVLTLFAVSHHCTAGTKTAQPVVAAPAGGR